MADLLKRDEAQRTGAYLLLGEDEEAVGNTRCYIGEADVVSERLRYHQREKDFWDRVVVITSKDANLTKAHGRYLESRIIELDKRAGRVKVENGTASPPPALPEADASDMDYFVSQLEIVLPVLGVNAIRVPTAKPGPSDCGDESLSPVFQLRNGKLGVDARAQQIDGEFTMLAGSKVVAAWQGVGKAASTMKAYMRRTVLSTNTCSPMVPLQLKRVRAASQETFRSAHPRPPAPSHWVDRATAVGSGSQPTARLRTLGEPWRRVTHRFVGRLCEYLNDHRLPRGQNCR